MKPKAMTIAEIEAEIDAEMDAVLAEIEEYEDEEDNYGGYRECVPNHWTPFPEKAVTDWELSHWASSLSENNAIFRDDGGDHLHIFGEHCKWAHCGFDGFMDDFGTFRYLPGNC